MDRSPVSGKSSVRPAKKLAQVAKTKVDGKFGVHMKESRKNLLSQRTSLRQERERDPMLPGANSTKRMLSKLKEVKKNVETIYFNTQMQSDNISDLVCSNVSFPYAKVLCKNEMPLCDDKTLKRRSGANRCPCPIDVRLTSKPCNRQYSYEMRKWSNENYGKNKLLKRHVCFM